MEPAWEITLKYEIYFSNQAPKTRTGSSLLGLITLERFGMGLAVVEGQNCRKGLVTFTGWS